MSQCLACDNELRGYMAMGKQVLTLTYIHTILLGIYDFSTLNLIAERLQNFTVKYTICLSCGKILCNQHSWFMFLCPNNQKERRGKFSSPLTLSVPEIAPLTRFAFNYVETQLHSLQNPSKLGSYSLVSVFATHAG